jgi:ABC-type oligopeptide transport system substrate-binding subunit
MAFLLSMGCGGSQSAEEGESEGDQRSAVGHGRAADAESARAQTMTIAVRQLPRGLDPLADLEPWGERIAEDLVFEGLSRATKDGEPWAEPALADQCEVDRERGARSVVCHIPTDRKFHDGREVTMEDVVYSLENWLDVRNVWRRQRHGLAGLRSVEVVDGPRGAGTDERDPGRWVRIGFSRSEPLALELISVMKIVPRKAHRGRASRFATAPLGTGPMKITTMAEDRWVLERSEHWPNEKQRTPVLNRLRFQEVNDGAEGLSLARRDEVQILDQVAPAHIPVELGKPAMSERFEAWLLTPPRYDVLMYNLSEGLQSGGRLRGALHDAVPFTQIEREVYKTSAVPSAAPVDLHEPRPLDLGALVGARSDDHGRGGLPMWRLPGADEAGRARAAVELDAIDWKVERGIRRKPGGRAAHVVEILKTQWRTLGIQLREATATWSYLLTLLRKGAFDIAMVRVATHSDADLYDLFHSRGEINISGVADGELDAALEAYRNAAGPAERRAAKERAAARLGAIRAFSVLHAPSQVMLISRRVEGVEFDDDLPRLDRLSLRPSAP